MQQLKSSLEPGVCPHQSDILKTMLASGQISIKILLVTHKALNNLTPEDLCVLVSCYEPPHLDHKVLLLTSSQYYEQKSIFIQSLPASNNLPVNVQDSDVVSGFKSRLKTYLFSQAFGNYIFPLDERCRSECSWTSRGEVNWGLDQGSVKLLHDNVSIEINVINKCMDECINRQINRQMLK